MGGLFTDVLVTLFQREQQLPSLVISVIAVLPTPIVNNKTEKIWDQAGSLLCSAYYAAQCLSTWVGTRQHARGDRIDVPIVQSGTASITHAHTHTDKH